MEEVHRVGVAAVLAADADLEVGAGRPGLPRRRSRPGGRCRRASRVSNGETPKMPRSMYRLKNEPSTSSREKPQPIWVRSLVPKEKNSAAWAIWPAVSAARGTSIIVPIRVCTCAPVSAATSASTFSALLARDLEFLDRADERDHDLRTRVAACLDPVGRGVRDRPHLHGDTGRGRPGRGGPRAGRASGSARAAAARPRAACGPGRLALSPASATSTDSSVRSGRNSCSGGSSSRMVTGSPSMASRISTKSPRCSGSSASSADLRARRRRRPGSAARPAGAARRGTCARSG